jgi:CO/xanthine dehydrogenase Mo-binding subunit/aerobic-type carbon monoxide dehydrogenase small subunit (CoxS/CutS family)
MSFDAPASHLSVNGQEIAVDADPRRRLSDVLREELGLKGTKVGCDAGDCGACTVLIDGRATCACMMPLGQATGRAIETIEHKDALLTKLQDAFHRHGAAQCGICTPGMLMTALELMRATQTPTRAEVSDALGGVLCRCTGYTKIIDAVCDATGATTTSPPPLVSNVGAPVARLDGRQKVDGSDVFGADFAPQDALWVRVLRSPHFAARFTFGDLAVWAKTHNVQVFTANDISGRNAFGVIPAFADQPALAENRTRMRGEAVALIAGAPEVMRTLAIVDFPIDWQAEDEVLDPQPAKTAPLLHDNRSGNELITGHVACGDASAALNGSAQVVEGQARTSYVEHAYIEPEAGSAWMDGDTLVIQACTQAPVMDQEDTAIVLGLPKERVRIIPASAGGGFGSKLDVSIQPLIGLVTLKTGRPSRIVYTRTESMQSTTKRHPGEMRARIGADATGRITAMEFDGDFNTGPYSSWGPTVANRVPVHASGPYKTPNYHAIARAIHTNGPVSGAFRGFGVPQAAILQETLYDELADKLGMDRLRFRRLNALQDGDKTPCGQELHGVGIAECFDALVPAWAESLAWAESSDGDIKRGVGVASCWYGCGNTALPNPSTVRAGISREGRIILHQGATDIGQGSNTVITQIFADALGVGLDAIDLVGPDTAMTPDCGKTSASRQTYVTGKAALAAGAAMRMQLLRHANLSATAKISVANGIIEITDGEALRQIDPLSLPLVADDYVFEAIETYDPPTTPLDENGQGIPYAVYGYGAQIARVEVDMKLGTTKVRHITAAHDLGRVINPMLAEGQIHGGIAQGLGMALMEEYIPGKTEDLHNYLIPTIGDMPDMDVIFIEKPDPEGPYGAKGLGEHALIPTAPAILNAIRHATGKRITQLPALPHRVLEAIRA